MSMTDTELTWLVLQVDQRDADQKSGDALDAILAECRRARESEDAMLVEYERLRAEVEAMQPLPRAPGLLTPERMAEIRADYFFDPKPDGPPLHDSVHDARALITHADTLEVLLRDLGGEPLAIREAGRMAEREAIADWLNGEADRYSQNRDIRLVRGLSACIADGRHDTAQAEAADVYSGWKFAAYSNGRPSHSDAGPYCDCDACEGLRLASFSATAGADA